MLVRVVSQVSRAAPTLRNIPVRFSSTATAEPRKWRRTAVIATGVVAAIGTAYAYSRNIVAERPDSIPDLGDSETGDPKVINESPKGRASESATQERRRQKLVVLGTGWGATSLLRQIDPDLYEVYVVSPRNYFLYTPLLPSVTVGSLETRSVCAPVRQYMHGDMTYYQANAVEIDPFENTVTCEAAVTKETSSRKFKLKYDKLVVAVGSINNTFGTPGVYENCSFLKEAADAERIRKSVLDLFEAASLPGLSEQERKKLLHFVVVGGGPTGVEFAAELNDFVKDDLLKVFPRLRGDITITIVELLDHILNTYDAKVSDYTEKHFKREAIEVATNTRVVSVEPDAVVVRPVKGTEDLRIPFGLCVWSTGIGCSPLITQLRSRLERVQTNRRALLTDEYLCVLGTHNIFALGDCATVYQPRLLDRIVELFHEADSNKDDRVSLAELRRLVEQNKHKFPQLTFYQQKVEQLFAMADPQGTGLLNEAQFRTVLAEVDKRVTSFPATAAVASQQGNYLGKHLNENYKPSPTVLGEPFRYRHLGSLAYVGSDRAVADLTGNIVLGGWGAWWLWRSFYWSRQISFRNRVLIAADWMEAIIFGRDVSKQ